MVDLLLASGFMANVLLREVKSSASLDNRIKKMTYPSRTRLSGQKSKKGTKIKAQKIYIYRIDLV
jgi:hypothetical protein